MRHAIAPVLVSFVALVAVGCDGSENPPSRPETVYEYAQMACGLDENLSYGATWGESRDLIKARVGILDNIIPPAEVEDYHMANLAGQKAALAFTKGKDAKATANPYEAIRDPAIMALGLAIQEIEDALPEQAWHTLAVHGCDLG